MQVQYTDYGIKIDLTDSEADDLIDILEDFIDKCPDSDEGLKLSEIAYDVTYRIERAFFEHSRSVNEGFERVKARKKPRLKIYP